MAHKAVVDPSTWMPGTTRPTSTMATNCPTSPVTWMTGIGRFTSSQWASNRTLALAMARSAPPRRIAPSPSSDKPGRTYAVNARARLPTSTVRIARRAMASRVGRHSQIRRACSP